MRDDFTVLASILIESAERERDGLQRVISKLLDASEIIPLDSAVLIHARELQAELGMSGQDAIVLASVIQDLQRTNPLDSCFLSRNSRDFDDPDVRARLDRLRCQYFGDFTAAVAHITQRLGS